MRGKRYGKDLQENISATITDNKSHKKSIIYTHRTHVEVYFRKRRIIQLEDNGNSFNTCCFLLSI